jgi:hypothetical protein
VDVQFNYLLKRTFTFLLIFLAVPIPVHAQEKTVSSPIGMPESSNQPNTAAGLRQLLEAMLEAAKHDDLAKLAALVKDTEVPDCALWLHSMYRSDHADSWMGLCDQKFRGPDEKLFIEHLVELARQGGRLLIRSVNDDPEPGKGMAWRMLESVPSKRVANGTQMGGGVQWREWLPVLPIKGLRKGRLPRQAWRRVARSVGLAGHPLAHGLVQQHSGCD